MKSFDEEPRSTSKGKTFGLSWKYYEKNYLKHRSDAYAEFHSEGNPAAQYDGTQYFNIVRDVAGDSTKKFTAYGRLKMYS